MNEPLHNTPMATLNRWLPSKVRAFRCFEQPFEESTGVMHSGQSARVARRHWMTMLKIVTPPIQIAMVVSRRSSTMIEWINRPIVTTGSRYLMHKRSAASRNRRMTDLEWNRCISGEK